MAIGLYMLTIASGCATNYSSGVEPVSRENTSVSTTIDSIVNEDNKISSVTHSQAQEILGPFYSALGTLKIPGTDYLYPKMNRVKLETIFSLEENNCIIDKLENKDKYPKTYCFDDLCFYPGNILQLFNQDLIDKTVKLLDKDANRVIDNQEIVDYMLSNYQEFKKTIKKKELPSGYLHNTPK